MWSSQPFGFVALSDAFTTGSSMLPQKRNPDAAELVRAKAGRIFGSLTALLTVMKGLPLAYAKDTQEDKAPGVRRRRHAGPVFTRDDRHGGGHGGRYRCDAPGGRRRARDRHRSRRLARPRPRRAVPRRAPGDGARRRGCRGEGLRLGRIVARRSADGGARITAEVFSVLGIEQSVKSRTSFGGTAPERVRAAAAEARKRCR